MSDDELYLIHIRDAVNDINEFITGGRDEFMASKLVQAAVLYKLQTLAESTQRLSEAIKSTQPQVSWRAIRGLRNVLAHDYTNIRLEEIWNILERDLPPLKSAVAVMLNTLEQDDEQKPTP